AHLGGERRLQQTSEASQDGLICARDFAGERPHRLAVGAPREFLDDDRDKPTHFHTSWPAAAATRSAKASPMQNTAAFATWALEQEWIMSEITMRPSALRVLLCLSDGLSVSLF